MYEAFYGLNGKPFNLTPDPRFLYLSQKHREAFAHLVYGIKNRSGFVMVSGEIGTGKTTICRSLLNQLDPDTELAFIFNPYLSQEELLRKINEEFGIDTRSQSVKGLIDELNEYLLRKASEGKNCVLVIDEAQNLEVKLLEQIRLLSNLETETQKLLQIILIGQPELVDKLNLPELRQLNQRITARYHLHGLDFDETMQYIAFRLRVAGGRRKVKFSRAAVRAVYVLSKGTPRVINALCDRSLLIGYTRETHNITAGIVRQAAREIQGEKIRGKERGTAAWLIPRAAAALVVAGGVIAAAFIPADAPVVGPVGATMRDAWRAVAPAALLTEGNLVIATVDESAPIDAAFASAVEAASLPATNLPEQETNPQTPEGRVESAGTSDADARAAEADFARDWLAETGREALRGFALTALLQSWNMAVLNDPPSEEGDAGIDRFAVMNGFAVERLKPTAEQLYAINLPALVSLEVGDGEVWTAILAVGADDDSIRLSADGGDGRSVAREWFEEKYAGAATIFWLDPAPQTPPLKPWSQGERVRALQEILLSLGLLDGPADGSYSRETIDAIRRIQQAAGLRVDGIAGEQTRMVLTGWLSDGPAPKLASESFPPSIRERVNGLRARTASAAPRRNLVAAQSVSAAPVRFENARHGFEGVPLGFENTALGFENTPLPDWETLAKQRETVSEQPVGLSNEVASPVIERAVTAPSTPGTILAPSQSSVQEGDAAQ